MIIRKGARKQARKQAGTVVFLAVVLLAALFYFNSQTAGTPTETVFINEGGFEPQILNIVRGTRVKFLNIGLKQHWPASNFHPTHTNYPSPGGCIGSILDACKGLASGEDYSFTFSMLGSWPMHDHISPGLTMVVEVVERSDLAESQKDDIVKVLSPVEFRETKYSNQIRVIENLSGRDAAETWEFLKSAMLVDGEQVGNAHELTHIVGNALHEQRGLDGFQVCDPSFAFGCYHGVTEGLLEDRGVEVVSEVQSKCLEIFSASKFAQRASCIHGMGHGLLTWEELDVSKAVLDCDLLHQEYRGYCYDGVFMENSWAQDLYDEENPWSFCLSLPQQYYRGCARYQIAIFLSNVQSDFSKVGKICAETAEEILRDTCSESLGFQAAQRAKGESIVALKHCQAVNDSEVRNRCTIGAAKETVFQAYKNWPETSYALCQSLIGSWREECFKSNEQTAKSYR